MKVLYSYTNNAKPLYVSNSEGVQRILVSFFDNGDYFVYFCDDYYRKTYLNKVINPKAADVYSIPNFKKIETDVEFYHYLSWIERTYNYNGLHIEEKITGDDRGGATLIDALGKPLLV